MDSSHEKAHANFEKFLSLMDLLDARIKSAEDIQSVNREIDESLLEIGSALAEAMPTKVRLLPCLYLVFMNMGLTYNEQLQLYTEGGDHT